MSFSPDISFIIAFLYVLFNTLCLVAYIPQVIKMLRDKHARRTAALSMWGIWTMGGAIELLYAFDIGNTPWMSMAVGHLLACGLVFSIGLYGKAELRAVSKKTKTTAVVAPSSPALRTSI